MEQLIDFHAPEVQAVLDTLLKDKSTGKNIIWAIPMLTLPPIMTSVGYFLAAANSSAPRVVSLTQASIITIWSSLRPTKTPEPTLTALRAMVKKLLPSRPTATGYRGTNFTLFTNTNNAYSAAFPQGNAVSAYFA